MIISHNDDVKNVRIVRYKLFSFNSEFISSRGGTVHVFVPNCHGTGISVQCMRPYDEYRQFTPNPEEGARSTATLFDNRQQKNSECHE